MVKVNQEWKIEDRPEENEVRQREDRPEKA